MDDLEICKRIAEIEGYVFDTGGKYFRCELTKHGKIVGYVDYNPLTDDALCFQLMVKYCVCLWPDSYAWIENEDKCTEKASCDINEKTNINKAICLAIIEAHKES